eukprot:COSAG01_NODE_3397_length_6144_cov_33.015550_7_plen_135_part_00
MNFIFDSYPLYRGCIATTPGTGAGPTWSRRGPCGTPGGLPIRGCPFWLRLTYVTPVLATKYGGWKRLDRLGDWLSAFAAGDASARALYLHDWSLSGHCPWALANFTVPRCNVPASPCMHSPTTRRGLDAGRPCL